MNLKLIVAVGVLISLIGEGGTSTSTGSAPPPVTEATLHKIAAALDMFVDELPMIPKVYGYSLRNGKPSPGRLTIGMYAKKWVRTSNHAPQKKHQ